MSALPDGKGDIIVRQGGDDGPFLDQAGAFQPLDPSETGTLSVANGVYQMRRSPAC